MNKIIEEGVLYEEDEEEGEDEFEFGESEAEELEEMLCVRPARADEEDEEGMLVSEEEAQEGEVFVPRVKLQAYMMNEGPNLRTKRNEGKKFTKGTDPRNKDVVNFMADENINCP